MGPAAVLAARRRTLLLRDDPAPETKEKDAPEGAGKAAEDPATAGLGKGQLPKHDIDDPKAGGSNASPGHDAIDQANDAASDPDAGPKDFGSVR